MFRGPAGDEAASRNRDRRVAENGQKLREPAPEAHWPPATPIPDGVFWQAAGFLGTAIAAHSLTRRAIHRLRAWHQAGRAARPFRDCLGPFQPVAYRTAQSTTIEARRETNGAPEIRSLPRPTSPDRRASDAAIPTRPR